MVAVEGAEQGVFSELAGFFEGAADAYADYEGRAGVGSGLASGFDDEVGDFGRVCGGLEHAKDAFVFAAAALGHDGEFELIAGYPLVVDDGWGVGLSVFAMLEGFGDDAFAEQAGLVTDLYALIYGVVEGGVRLVGGQSEVAGAALFDENYGKAGVLAEGEAVIFCDFGVLEQLVDEFDGGRVRFGLAGALEGCNHLVIEIITGAYAELTDGVNYRLVFYVTHDKGLIIRYLRFVRPVVYG